MDDEKPNFENKIAIVTGGAQGLGKAVCSAMAEQKARGAHSTRLSTIRC